MNLMAAICVLTVLVLALVGVVVAWHAMFPSIEFDGQKEKA